MKKWGIFGLVFVLAFSIAGCQTEKMGAVDEKENGGLSAYESDLGFAVSYDTAAFTQRFENDMEVFRYEAEENLDFPIYIAVYLRDDMDKKTVADGLALQSGEEDAFVSATRFGADRMESAVVQYKKEQDGGEQIFSFHVVDTEKGTMIVETVGYAGQSKKADSKLEEFLANFSVK